MHNTNVSIDMELDEISQIAAEVDGHRALPASDKWLKKVKKHLSEEELDSMDQMTVEDLRAKIVLAQRGLADVATSRELDEGLKRAKEQVAELEAPYADTRDRLTSVTAYAIFRLRELGK